MKSQNINNSSIRIIIRKGLVTMLFSPLFLMIITVYGLVPGEEDSIIWTHIPILLPPIAFQKKKCPPSATMISSLYTKILTISYGQEPASDLISCKKTKRKRYLSNIIPRKMVCPIIQYMAYKQTMMVIYGSAQTKDQANYPKITIKSFPTIKTTDYKTTSFLMVHPISLPTQTICFSVVLMDTINLTPKVFLKPLSLPGLISMIFL